MQPLVEPLPTNRQSGMPRSAKLDAISQSQAVIEFGLDGTIVSANQNFLNARWVYTLAEIQGRHHSMFVDPSVVASQEYRDFWSALNRGEFRAG